MRTWRVRGLLAALAGGLLVLAPAAAGASTGSTRWTVMPTPAGDHAYLTGVSCASPTVCLAAGVGNYALAALALQGGKWRPVAAPSGPGNPAGDFLFDVACPSAADCIAVGSYSNRYKMVTDAWRWNGTRWSTLATVNPPSSDYDKLTGISCLSAASCEAVGSQSGETGASAPLAEHWNGSAWSVQSTTGAPAYSELRSVSCQSAGCEAVGSVARADTPLAMGLSGSHWVTQPTPALPVLGHNPDGGLQDVSCYQGGCLAVGGDYYTAGGQFRADIVTEKWNGTSWALAVKVGTGDPAGWPQANVSAVSCTSAAHCVLAGDRESNTATDNLADSWNGSTWTVGQTPNPGSGSAKYGGDMLEDVACTGTVCYTGGYQTPGDGSLIERN